VNVLKTASPTPVRPEVMFSDTRAECRTCGAHVRVGGRVGSVAAASKAQPAWDALGGAGRATVLRAMADALEADRDRLVALCALEAGKTYKVAGWASVNEQSGAPVWDVVARHLRAGKPPSRQAFGVTLKGVDGDPGIAGQG